MKSISERLGVSDSLAELSTHRCSLFRHPATGRLAPWHVKLDDQLVEQPVVPAIISNDEFQELQAVLPGKVLGQLAGATAAPYIRSGQLVPILLEHMPDIASYFVYFCSRTSQLARARTFVDLAVERFTDCPQYVLTSKELSRSRYGAEDRQQDKGLSCTAWRGTASCLLGHSTSTGI